MQSMENGMATNPFTQKKTKRKISWLAGEGSPMSTRIL